MSPSKYRAVKTVVDGITFASKKEAARYQELRLLEKAGEIYGLELQPVFHLRVEGGTKPVAKYVADFQYQRKGFGGAQRIVEDVKGFKTPVYRLKKKMVREQYGIEIREV